METFLPIMRKKIEVKVIKDIIASKNRDLHSINLIVYLYNIKISDIAFQAFMTKISKLRTADRPCPATKFSIYLSDKILEKPFIENLIKKISEELTSTNSTVDYDADSRKLTIINKNRDLSLAWHRAKEKKMTVESNAFSRGNKTVSENYETYIRSYVIERLKLLQVQRRVGIHPYRKITEEVMKKDHIYFTRNMISEENRRKIESLFSKIESELQEAGCLVSRVWLNSTSFHWNIILKNNNRCQRGEE